MKIRGKWRSQKASLECVHVLIMCVGVFVCLCVFVHMHVSCAQLLRRRTERSSQFLVFHPLTIIEECFEVFFPRIAFPRFLKVTLPLIIKSSLASDVFRINLIPRISCAFPHQNSTMHDV